MLVKKGEVARGTQSKCERRSQSKSERSKETNMMTTTEKRTNPTLCDKRGVRQETGGEDLGVNQIKRPLTRNSWA